MSERARCEPEVVGFAAEVARVRAEHAEPVEAPPKTLSEHLYAAEKRWEDNPSIDLTAEAQKAVQDWLSEQYVTFTNRLERRAVDRLIEGAKQ